MRNIIDELIDDLGDAIDENKSYIPRAVPTRHVNYSQLPGVYTEHGRLIFDALDIANMAVNSPEGEADVCIEGFGNAHVIWNDHSLAVILE